MDHAEAVLAWQHQINQRERWRFAADGGHDGVNVGCPDHAVAFKLQRVADRGQDQWIIFDHDNTLWHQPTVPRVMHSC
jgi:hypothetical protein